MNFSIMENSCIFITLHSHLKLLTFMNLTFKHLRYFHVFKH